MNSTEHADVRDLLAAERSFLAWNRTGIALMGFGFVVAHFGLFLQQITSFGKDQESEMTSAASSGMISKSSKHSVDETVERLKTTLQSKGVTLFALIDHSGEAEKVGMKMPATKLLIFGNPKAGTPLMQASPGIAIDLPLKILVAEDSNGKVSVSYNSPEYLQQRHGLAPELLLNIAVVEALAAKAAEYAYAGKAIRGSRRLGRYIEKQP